MKGPEDNAAEVKYDACAIGKDKGKLNPCPGERSVDSDGTPDSPDDLPEGNGCMADKRAGFCMSVKSCQDKKREPLKGEKGSGGKYPCGDSDTDSRCCVYPKKKKRPRKCTVNKRSGVCMDSGKCRNQKKKSAARW